MRYEKDIAINKEIVNSKLMFQTLLLSNVIKSIHKILL